MGLKDRALAVLVASVVAGCSRAAANDAGRGRRAPEPASPAPASVPATVDAAAGPVADADDASSAAIVEALDVPGDLPASVVRPRGETTPRVVFLPGICSNANAYLREFPEAARRHGGVVAIEGDRPCGVPGYRSFSWDAPRQHARIEAALRAAGAREIPPAGVVLVGYSQGAALAEQLAQRWPERYTRIGIIASPRDPVAKHFARARAVVTMACSRDVTARMRDASRRIAALGVPSTYVEMPGCTHGQVADGENAFDTALRFLEEHGEAPASP